MDRNKASKSAEEPGKRIESDRVIRWLLEDDQPAVRYYTLTDILDASPAKSHVKETYEQIPRRGWAAEILKTQKQGGFWESRENLYRPKYAATIWKLIVLADLGVTARLDKRIATTCQLFLDEYPMPDGGFDVPGSKYRGSELCLTGNLARTLLRCGWGDDRRVAAAFDWLVANQRRDGGWHCYESSKIGTLDCWEALSAYSYLPRERWTRRIRNSIERGAEFYLERVLYREGKRAYKPWFRFHYPVHYYYDILVGLDVLTALGYGSDKRLRAPLEILRKKRRRDGTWALDAVHPDLGWGAGYSMRRPIRFAVEEVGKPSKWITLVALRVLRRAGADYPR